MNRVLNLIVLLASTVVIANCSKKSSDTLAVTPQNLAGTWELESLSVGSMTAAPDSYSEAKAAGYKDGYEKTQLEITESTISMINSDELAVQFVMTKKYTLQGNRIVPNSTKESGLSSLEVVTLKKDSLSVKFDQSEPKDLIANFKRIQKEELATQKLKPIGQNSYFQLNLGTEKLEDSFTADFSSTYKSGANPRINCRMTKGKSGINFMASSGIVHATQPSEDGASSISMSSNDPGFSINAYVPFDFSKPSETITIDLKKGNDHSVSGVYNKNGKQMQFMMSSNSICKVNIHRMKRNLSISAECGDMDILTPIVGTPTGKAHLLASKQCILAF